MFLECADFLQGNDIPELYGGIVGARGQGLAIRSKGQVEDSILVRDQELAARFSALIWPAFVDGDLCPGTWLTRCDAESLPLRVQSQTHNKVLQHKALDDLGVRQRRSGKFLVLRH